MFTRMVLTKKMGDATLLSSPRIVTSTLEAAEEALAIVGAGVIESKGNEIIVHQYLREAITFRLSPASDWI